MLPTKKEVRLFYRDRVMTFLFSVVAFLGIVTVLMVVTRVHSSDLQVPVRYTEYALTLERGDWLVLYELAAFVIIIAAINTMLAMRARELNRTYGTVVLLITIIILIVGLLVSNSLLGLVVV